MDVYEKLQKSLAAVRGITDFKPKLALVLGSGLGAFGDRVKSICSIPYAEIDGFPVSTVQGHQGRFIFCMVGTVPIVVMQGRVHYYEGYDMQDVVLPIRLMKLMGAEELILTNAAGGINRSFVPGDLMQVTGHISTFVPSPLRGANVEELGVRFPDMSAVYDKDWLEEISAIGQRVGVPLKRGVYVQTPGPNYETPEEIRMFETLGADAVGMSTACEAIAARYMGMRVAAISCISNMAAGISKQPLSHQEVKETADKTGPRFEKLLEAVIKQKKQS